MASKSFPIELLGRIALLLLISLAVAWLAISGRYYAGLVIATLLLFLSALELWRRYGAPRQEAASG